MLCRISSLWLLLAVVLISSCQNHSNSEGQLKHVVLCWLKDQKPETKASFINSVKSLSEIPTVKKVEVGAIERSSEPVADNSFDLAFIISFNSKADLNEYLTHPKHIAAVQSVLKPSLKKVIVYDFKTN